MKRGERTKLTVTMDVTEAQALALQAMFEYWNTCSGMGASRDVGFNVDGDGDFNVACEIVFDPPIRTLTDNLRKLAVMSDENGDRIYDYDRIAWAIHYGKNMYTGEILES